MAHGTRCINRAEAIYLKLSKTRLTEKAEDWTAEWTGRGWGMTGLVALQDIFSTSFPILHRSPARSARSDRAQMAPPSYPSLHFFHLAERYVWCCFVWCRLSASMLRVSICPITNIASPTYRVKLSPHELHVTFGLSLIVFHRSAFSSVSLPSYTSSPSRRACRAMCRGRSYLRVKMSWQRLYGCLSALLKHHLNFDSLVAG